MNRYRYIKISFFSIAAVSVLLLYFFVEPKNGNLPKCLFHEITGFYCPGCGVQRSFHSLLNGRLLDAMNYNLLFILFLPMIIFFLSTYLLGKKINANSIIYKKKFSFTVVIIFISFWILRNVPFTPFNWLAP